MIGFEKLWEGDVTGSSDDITGGTVDLSEYQFLIVHYVGTLTNPYSDGSTFEVAVGARRTKSDGNPTYDFSLAKNWSGPVNVTVHMIRRSAPMLTNNWDIFRYPMYTGGCATQTTTPLKFFGPSGQPLHFSVYGLKL